MIELLDYQKRAVERLRVNFNDAFRSKNPENIIFQSPTGSGKTVMTSELIKEIARSFKDKISFVWISVRALHEQSKEKLETYYKDDQLIKCSYFEDLEDKQIGSNEILFLNWHSINMSDKNILMKPNETETDLISIINNTREEGRKIILIIDESHHTAKSERSIDLILNKLKPEVTIEVSATPHITQNVNYKYSVLLSDVKDEEIIKSEIAINPDFMDLKEAEKSADEIILSKSLEKREELAKLYKKEKTKINPLMLIQLPDGKSGDEKKEEIINFLQKKEITFNNGKLAIWLADNKEKINKENIEKEDNEAEVLIFKQAPALGWDCPRASILVVFRESKSFKFTIQTVGRIMRMPERKYYNSDELNKGFVFTNLPNITITEDYAKNYITIFESRRREVYNGVSIPSIYMKRYREKTRLSGEFAKIFKKIALDFKLKEKIVEVSSDVVSPIIADGKITDIDKIGEISKEGQINLKLSDFEIFKKFDKFCYDLCTPYAPADSSGRIKTALYNFIEEEFDIKKYSVEAQKLILGRENVSKIFAVIGLTKNKYKEYVETLGERRESILTSKWEVPTVDRYKENANKENHPKSIMDPFFSTKIWGPEAIFMEALDNSNKVIWWYKNGEREKKYLSIPYIDEKNKEWGFYVDFIVKFKDGTIGLFDTKQGSTAKNAGPKAVALQKYIKKYKKLKIWGGIIVPSSQNLLMINENKEYEYDSNLTKFRLLEEI